MLDAEKIYYSYKNKTDIYYLTDEEEQKLLNAKYALTKTLSDEQFALFSKLEMTYSSYKEAIIKEIINYSISFRD